MTFEQIVSRGATYVNQNGVVFTPDRDAGKILVSYPIDRKTFVALLPAAHILTALFSDSG